MARKYKYHKYYSVIFFDRRHEQWYIKHWLTLREAREYVRTLDIVKDEITHVEIVKRMLAIDYYDGRIPLEEI